MKPHHLLVLIFPFLVISPSRGQAPLNGQRAPEHSDFDPASQFIFFSVLEGLYEDGLSNKDVDQILMKKKDQNYFHFIYACPVCTATIWALETYRARPEKFYSLKSNLSTFGPGLSLSLHDELYNEDPLQRLIAINTLVKDWITRRMESMNLSRKDRASLVNALELKRKNGLDVLESFRRGEHGAGFGVEQSAPAYINLDECAVCNGAVGKVMKLPSAKK